MSGRFFRLVFFTPDPVFQTARFAVAALMEVENATSVVIAKRLPCSICAGGEASLWTMASVVTSLPLEVSTIARMPESAGPHFSLGEEWRVPSAVVDPASWLRDFVLPGGKTP